jgi:hypothetical protein
VEATEWIVLIVVVLLALAVAGYFVAQARKRKQLQSRFGPEYDRTVESTGRRRDAERELAERAQRRQQLDIRPLPADERRAFADRWRATQADFVDRPGAAVRAADQLVEEVMRRRGYPVGDFDQMARDVSVDHAGVVQEYRAAHDISELNDREQASTEQLRQAMVHYRALFTELLAESDDAGEGRDSSDDDVVREHVVVDREPVQVEHERPVSDVDGGTDGDRAPVDRERVHVDRAVDASRTERVRTEPGGLTSDRDRGDVPPRT